MARRESRRHQLGRVAARTDRDGSRSASTGSHHGRRSDAGDPRDDGGADGRQHPTRNWKSPEPVPHCLRADRRVRRSSFVIGLGGLSPGGDRNDDGVLAFQATKNWNDCSKAIPPGIDPVRWLQHQPPGDRGGVRRVQSQPAAVHPCATSHAVKHATTLCTLCRVTPIN